MDFAPYSSGGSDAPRNEEEDLLTVLSEARQYLGITTAEFWELTPRDLRAQWTAFQGREVIWNRRIGLLASLQYNANRKKNSKAIEPHEWFNDPAPKKQQTVDEIKNNLMTWAHLVKGK